PPVPAEAICAAQATTIVPSSCSAVSMPLPLIASSRRRTSAAACGSTPSSGVAAVTTPRLFSLSLSRNPIAAVISGHRGRRLLVRRLVWPGGYPEPVQSSNRRVSRWAAVPVVLAILIAVALGARGFLGSDDGGATDAGGAAASTEVRVVTPPPPVPAAGAAPEAIPRKPPPEHEGEKSNPEEREPYVQVRPGREAVLRDD